MKVYSYYWCMNLRRIWPCLLVVVFTAITSLFMFSYPQLIADTQQRLDEAYDSIVVKGWMSSASGFDDPNIPGKEWRSLVDSTFLSAENSYSSFEVGMASMSDLSTMSINPEERMTAFQKNMNEEESVVKPTKFRAFSNLQASTELVQLVEDDGIDWLEGWDTSCLTGEEKVCILPESKGYLPGDMVMITFPSSKPQVPWGAVVELKVVGTYRGGSLTYVGSVPMNAYEQLCVENNLYFSVNGFAFEVDDNRKLPELKSYLIEKGFDGSGSDKIRTGIDDRILQGTVSPIENNLALLEGLYLLFFAVITLIGFFLCFLLARNRKAEYAVMRLLGESGLQITVKALLEQSLLCLMGVLLGIVAVLLMGQGMANLLIGGIIFLCYTVGAAVAVLMTVRVNVMEILRDKE